MRFPRQFFGVEKGGSRAAFGSVLGVVMALAACGGSSDSTDADEVERPATPTEATAPASTAATTRGNAAASSAAPASGASAPAPSAPAPSAPARDAAPSTPAASAPSAAAEMSAPSAAAAPTASSQLTFAKDIWPIFNSKCGPCHVTQRQGGHNVGSEDLDVALEAALDRQDDILRELRSQAMPPGCSRVGASQDKCVSKAEIDEISSWYSDGSPP